MKTLKQILHENLLKEDKTDIFNDPKAIALIDWLNNEEIAEVGIADVTIVEEWTWFHDLNIYRVYKPGGVYEGSLDWFYVIVTTKEMEDLKNNPNVDLKNEITIIRYGDYYFIFEDFNFEGSRFNIL